MDQYHVLESDLFTDVAQATDKYLQTGALFNKLKQDYKMFGRIIVAYDFDDTVFSVNPKLTSQVRELLKVISKYPDIFKMVVYTARTPELYGEVRRYLDKEEIRYDKINEPIPGTFPDKGQKILYSVFLDDRAGLRTAYTELVNFTYWVLDKKGWLR